MNKIIGIIALLFMMQWAQAGTICNAKSALADARLNLMMMVMSTEKAEQDFLKRAIDKASIVLEKEIDILLKDDNKNDDAQLKIFQSTWHQFKNTRETQIIPAIRAGNHPKALKIAIGVQAKRMKIMNGVIRALDGDDCNY